MAYAGQDFSPQAESESIPLTFKFGPMLASGETISTVTWAITVVEGEDLNAADHLVGSALVAGTETTQRVEGLLNGVRYRLTVDAVTNQGNHFELYADVEGVSPAGDLTVEDGTGLEDADSYVSLSEANAYFDNRLFSSAWTSATDKDKQRALIGATRMIDATVRFTGAKASSAQALEWPRTGMFDRDSLAISSSAIPRLMKDITCEVALTMLKSDRLLESDADIQGLSSLRAGPVTLTFKNRIPAPPAVADAISRMFLYSWIWRPIPGPILV